MEIAILHYAAPPVVGGVESVIGHHARLLADGGHALRVLAGRGAQTDERVQFIRLPLVDSRHPDVLAAKAELDAGRLPPNFLLLVERIRDELSAALVGADRIIAHNVCSLHKNLALTAALRQLVEDGRAPRLILWHHDLAWTTPRYRRELHDGYPWDLLRTDWPEAVQVVISEARRDELAELLAVPLERVRVIPNGVDAARFLKLESHTQDLIGRLDLLSAAPLLLLPVRITARKNIELALRVLAPLRERLPHAALVVTGPLGPHNPANLHYFEKLLSLRSELGLQGAAHFLAELSAEYLPDEVIADFYRLADALLFPSKEEGFGIPVLEAGLAGIPAFCADIPPLRELGRDDVTYFAADANPGEIAARMAECFQTHATYRLRERVRSQYTWERIFQTRIAPLLKE